MNFKQAMKLSEELRDSSLIHGTHRPEDLIPAFMDALLTLDPARHAKLTEEYSRVFLLLEQPDFEIVLRDYGKWDEVQDDMHYLLNEELFDALDLIPGCYFGPHPGDGSDYGWWSIESD